MKPRAAASRGELNVQNAYRQRAAGSEHHRPFLPNTPISLLKTLATERQAKSIPVLPTTQSIPKLPSGARASRTSPRAIQHSFRLRFGYRLGRRTKPNPIRRHALQTRSPPQPSHEQTPRTPRIVLLPRRLNWPSC
ncbi:hypothetical protein B0T14DRAFT_509414 [Immersiella caudata]|uniref:Uncharacterized protein n=1 Tax=Immersiella caudata TaxID=314043 RepID=A0AA39X2T4_9PEZI|nr:hypothetical protein B0T14DRAFT_509414 [Immersiella caudata]